MQSDLAMPERWQASQRRSRSRRLAAARSAARRRIGRRGAVVVVAAMTLGAGGAAAAQGTGGASPAAITHAAGTSVKAVQRALSVKADGHYGPQTRRAVKRFQRSHGLTVDGIVGPATLAALGLATKSSAAAPASTAVPSVLRSIAECESGGDPTAVSSSGRYRGKYQFTTATWTSLGGTGDPAAAPEAEQDQRAAALYAREGSAPWPVCGAAA